VPSAWLPDAANGNCFADSVDVDDFDWIRFLRDYVIHPRPLLIRRGAKMRRMAAIAYTKVGLLKVAGDTELVAQEFPYAGHQISTPPWTTTVRNYVSYLDRRKTEKRLKKDLLYVFMNLEQRDRKQRNISFAHFLPSIFEDKIRPFNTQFYIGGDLMGAPLHFHDAHALNSLVHGRKLWLLRPPSEAIWSNEAMYKYMHRTRGGAGSLRCLQESGDLLYVPRRWTHGVLCLSDCIGAAHEFDISDIADLPPAYQNLSLHHDSRIRMT